MRLLKKIDFITKEMVLKKHIWFLLCIVLVSSACKKNDDTEGLVVYPPANSISKLTTDKAIYVPGEEVQLLFEGNNANLRVRYKYLGEVLQDMRLPGNEWTWTPPSTDFKGYMAEVIDASEDKEKVVATIGIDVSSDWTKFPRYGFLSNFPNMEERAMKTIMSNLNRHHINGIQFYDWHYKHHLPLAGAPESPMPVYKDIINRDVHLSTIQQYIALCRGFGMKAMFYNLIFGAMDDAQSDGVANEWYLYTDNNHTEKDKHPLPKPPFKSDIYLLNPANTAWQQYLIHENSKVYEALPFDGFHMDQLGNRSKNLYTYEGTPVDLPQTYGPFITAIKAAHEDKILVMNAVDQYGQDQIGQAPTGFLYSEVWSANSFADLANVIIENNTFSNNTKNTVLAAYMNYDMADQRGSFNTPAVLLTDAVIFAFGGAHLELGEHMLGKEYFPNDNLSMKNDLKEVLPTYYDFLVAYQNLLRDGGTFNDPELSSDGKIRLNNWQPKQGEVSIIGKKMDNKQIVHLINFSDATTLEWKDNSGIQAYPTDIEEINLQFTSTGNVKKVWFASPDYAFGASREIEFSQTGNEVSFTIPLLRYWDMIVIEY